MRQSEPTKSTGEILHVYDDIEEADNNLPTWWLLTFYGAVVFGLVYWFYFHEYAIGGAPTAEVRGGSGRSRSRAKYRHR